MGKLHIAFATGDYDRIRPLMMDKVKPEGINLNFILLEPEELFWRAIQNEEFDVCEFSMGSYFVLRGKLDDRFVAIPVFPSREFRHSAVYINKYSNIETGEDLKGKKIGVPDYTMTATVWIRGFLQDDYGVSPRDVQWFTGGLNSPGRKQRVSVKLPDDIDISYIGDDRILSDMLEKGEIDALIGSREPNSFHTSCNVTRLWPDYVEVEKEYYKRTKVFPIMHTVAIRRSILEKHPWVALSLYKALYKAKEICQKEIEALSTSMCMIPWYRVAYQNALKMMGRDYWPYGVEKNRKALELFSRYSYEQGLTKNQIKIEDIFAPSTLEQFVI